MSERTEGIKNREDVINEDITVDVTHFEVVEPITKIVQGFKKALETDRKY